MEHLVVKRCGWMDFFSPNVTFALLAPHLPPINALPNFTLDAPSSLTNFNDVTWIFVDLPSRGSSVSAFTTGQRQESIRYVVNAALHEVMRQEALDHVVFLSPLGFSRSISAVRFQ